MLPLNNIRCQDCLELLQSLPPACVDLVVTDPPYNVSQPNNLKYNGGVIVKDFGSWDYGFDPLPVLKELKRVLKPNGQIYVFCGTKQIPIYMNEFLREWNFRNLLVWYKTNPAPRLSKTNFIFATEYIVYAINEKDKVTKSCFNFSRQGEMHNVFVTGSLQGRERLRNSDGKVIHPTQKPLSILKKLILTSSNPEDVVLDCFMGTGSTAVACLQTGRNFVGCEKDPSYAAVAQLRVQQCKEGALCLKS